MTIIQTLYENRKSVLFSIISRVFPAIFSIYALSVITQRVSPEEYGKYQTIFVYASILAVIVFSSVNMAYGRYFYNRKNALLYSLLFFIIISLIAATAVLFFEKSTLVILLAFFIGISSFLIQYSRYCGYNYLLLIQAIGKTTLFPILFLFFLSNATYTEVAYAMLFSLVFVPLVSIRNIYNRLLAEKQFELKINLQTFFRFGFVAGLGTTITVLTHNVDKVLLGLKYGKSFFGIYSANIQLIEFGIVMFFSIMSSVIYPKAVEMHEKAKSIQPLIKFNFWISLIVAFVFFFIGLLFYKSLYTIVLPNEYGLPIRIVLLAIISTCMTCIKTQALDVFLHLKNATRYVVLLSLLSLMLYSIFGYFALENYGIEHFFYVALLSKGLTLLLTLLIIRHLYYAKKT